MSSCTEFLTELGFEEILDNSFYLGHIDEDDIEDYRSLYEQNISILQDEFDGEFIVNMFLCYNSVFVSSDFSEMINQIKKQFDTKMWVTLIQYEWNETGESSVFQLMDVHEMGCFEFRLATICDKVRSLWVNVYGDAEL